MKLFICLSSLLLAILPCGAQELNYYFEEFTNEYQDLNQAISLSDGDVWDDPNYTVPIGFDFMLYDVTTTHLFFKEDFGGIVYSLFLDLVIAVSTADLADRSYEVENTASSPISYLVEGEEGSKIFKLEWKNAGYHNDDEKQYYINLQLWLYQGSNMIEIHYGPNNVDNPFYNFQEDYCAIGKQNMITGFKEAHVVEEIWNNFVFNYHVIDSTYEPETFSSIPENGTVFRIYPEYAIGIKEDKPNSMSVYPNPCNDKFSVYLHKESEGYYTISDLLGKTLIKGVSRKKQLQVNVQSLAAGQYILQYHSDGEIATQKFIKN